MGGAGRWKPLTPFHIPSTILCLPRPAVMRSRLCSLTIELTWVRIYRECGPVCSGGRSDGRREGQTPINDSDDNESFVRAV